MVEAELFIFMAWECQKLLNPGVAPLIFGLFLDKKVCCKLTIETCNLLAARNIRW